MIRLDCTNWLIFLQCPLALCSESSLSTEKAGESIIPLCTLESCNKQTSIIGDDSENVGVFVEYGILNLFKF